MSPGYLTHDERLAADAAFAGRPFNPKWSLRAKAVYDGLLSALPPPDLSDASHAEDAPSGILPEAVTNDPTEAETASHTPLPGPSLGDTKPGDTLPAGISFRRAIDSGALIDVTPAAKQLGFSFQVTVTKPLWEVGIAPVETLNKEEQSARLRDVLMAFRLRLASQPTVSPLIDFPALLAIPPGSIPQPTPLFALIQPDDQNRATVTLLLPTEVSTTMIPLN
ncbi:hypothetical protein [Nitrospira sp. KM1]|uniref:hypothetical protein n=1 Tax=Nitrospira sp. KM1 TaxID=1936990 RepID=UPI0015655E8A|nr:hypothetical protein [Nitrospira sp. KM1]